MVDRPSARDAYVRAEISTALAHQIRAIRQQRGWTQAELAKKMMTTQAVISRLENPEYGNISLKTLFDLSKVFDTGLKVQFVSLVSMLRETFHVSYKEKLVETFEDEADHVAFYDNCSTTYQFPVLMKESFETHSIENFSVNVGFSEFNSLLTLDEEYMVSEINTCEVENV